MPDLDRYDPPPVPPGVSADAQYMALVHAHATNALLTDAHRRHVELVTAIIDDDEHRPGLGGWLVAKLNTLPMPVQLGVMVVGGQLALQLSGALYENLVGRPPPQVTVPTIMAQPIPVSASTEPVTPGETP